MARAIIRIELISASAEIIRTIDVDITRLIEDRIIVPPNTSITPILRATWVLAEDIGTLNMPATGIYTDQGLS